MKALSVFLGFLSGGQLWRHILVAQRILPRATQNSVFSANMECWRTCCWRNFLAAAVFSVSYFLNVVEEFRSCLSKPKEKSLLKFRFHLFSYFDLKKKVECNISNPALLEPTRVGRQKRRYDRTCAGVHNRKRRKRWRNFHDPYIVHSSMSSIYYN